MTNKKEATTDLKSVKSPKTTEDFAKYFQTPSLKDAKKRGKEEISVHYDFGIPEEMQGIGKGKSFLVRTYGCPYVISALN